MQEAQVSQEQETSKIIKVVETPEDLYILGELNFEWSEIFHENRPEHEAVKKLIEDNWHFITDDYNDLHIKGRNSPKANFSIETDGGFIVLTASELQQVIDAFERPYINDIEMHELHYSNFSYDYYYGILHDFKGTVEVAMISYDDESVNVLAEYTKGEGLLYCPRTDDDDETQAFAFACLLVDTGNRFSYLTPPEALGYKRETSLSREVLFTYGGRETTDYDHCLHEDRYEEMKSLEERGYLAVGEKLITTVLWKKK